MEDIVNHIKSRLGEEVYLNVIVNKNTLRCKIITNSDINVTKYGTMEDIFGFSPRFLPGNAHHDSDSLLSIIRMNSIRAKCNITTESYINGEKVHTIHQFFPSVPTGYKIIEVPNNVIYLPVTIKAIYNLYLRFVDQNGKLVNFTGETIKIRLHIKSV